MEPTRRREKNVEKPTKNMKGSEVPRGEEEKRGEATQKNSRKKKKGNPYERAQTGGGSE